MAELTPWGRKEKEVDHARVGLALFPHAQSPIFAGAKVGVPGDKTGFASNLAALA